MSSLVYIPQSEKRVRPSARFVDIELHCQLVQQERASVVDVDDDDDDVDDAEPVG